MKWRKYHLWMRFAYNGSRKTFREYRAINQERFQRKWCVLKIVIKHFLRCILGTRCDFSNKCDFLKSKSYAYYQVLTILHTFHYPYSLSFFRWENVRVFNYLNFLCVKTTLDWMSFINFYLTSCEVSFINSEILKISLEQFEDLCRISSDAYLFWQNL